MKSALDRRLIYSEPAETLPVDLPAFDWDIGFFDGWTDCTEVGVRGPHATLSLRLQVPFNAIGETHG